MLIDDNLEDLGGGVYWDKTDDLIYVRNPKTGELE